MKQSYQNGNAAEVEVHDLNSESTALVVPENDSIEKCNGECKPHKIGFVRGVAAGVGLGVGLIIAAKIHNRLSQDGVI